jgi:hypothetical protein
VPLSRKLEHLLLRHVRALEAQTQAIDRLAASNEALVIAMFEGQDAPAAEEEEPGVELDIAGRRLRMDS